MLPRRIMLRTVVAALAVLAVPSLAVAQTVSTLQSSLNAVSDVAVDAAGNVYVTQRAPTNAVLKFAGGMGPASTYATGFADPSGIVIDSQGNLFVSCYTGDRVDKVAPGGVRTIFATGISDPGAIVIDPLGNLYVGEYFTQAVKKITPAGVVTAYGAAGLGAGLRLTAMLYEPDGRILCGTLGTGDATGPFPIRSIPAGGGTGTFVVTSSLPITGIARGALGQYYFACYQSRVLASSVLPAAPQIYAGALNNIGFVDGPALTARFSLPAALAFDQNGVLYVTDTLNDAVRTVNDPQATPVEPTSWGRLKTLYR